ncbi:MAG: hypothetical protein RIC35_09620 [Marinoscillum sp.]
MKNPLFPISIVLLLCSLTSCFTAEEYFFDARPDSTTIERNVQLINDHYAIQSKVFYRNFQKDLGVEDNGSLKYEQVKIKGDGSVFIMGSKQTDASATVEKFEFKTDENFSNLTTITSLTQIPSNLRENYFTGPSDDYFYTNKYLESGHHKVDIYRNGDSIGTVEEFSSKYRPAWHLSTDDKLYGFRAFDGNSGSGISQITLLNHSSTTYSWPGAAGSYIRSSAVVIGQIPYAFGISGSTVDVYSGNYTETYRDAEQVQYQMNFLETVSNIKAFGHVYYIVSDDIDAYILALEYNNFRLVKYHSTHPRALTQVADFTAEYEHPNAGGTVVLLKSGVAFIMVTDGNEYKEDGSHTYELFKVSAAESKSYGIISTKDFDSNIDFHYEDYFIIDDEPVIWFSSGDGLTYSDHLLVVKPQ